MGFTVAGKFAVNAAEPFQSIERHAVKPIQRAERIDSVLGVPGIVHVIKRFMPFATLRGKHNAMNDRVHFRKGCGTAPVAGGATDHRMDIHQGDQCPRRARIRQSDIRPGGVFHRGGVLGRTRGRGGQFGFEMERREGRRFDGFNDGGISSHSKFC